jgi:hypothetical protein
MKILVLLVVSSGINADHVSQRIIHASLFNTFDPIKKNNYTDVRYAPGPECPSCWFGAGLDWGLGVPPIRRLARLSAFKNKIK